ncbi:biotin-dependent carboxyltransferase family protein [soil metagenome]
MISRLAITVDKPGLFSTFQDLGRSGHQHLGVPVAGAMDEMSHCIANWLVGNAESEATLEITMIGPALHFSRAAWVALAGADLGARVVARGSPPHDGVDLAPSLPHWLPAGSTLEFGSRLSGLRAYLAIRGGFGLPATMGSVSTHVRTATGGFQGRGLRKGDRLVIAQSTSLNATVFLEPTVWTKRLMADLQDRDFGLPIRITRGREWEQFTVRSQASLVSARAVVTAQSDRMACRLLREPLELKVKGDMLSEAVAFGTVQVPPDGLPIVLMADRQSTGGYPRIAQVASVDLPRLAQVKPGESVRFELVEPHEAQALLADRAFRCGQLRAALQVPTPRTTKANHG